MQKEFGYARVFTAHQREDRQIQRLLEYGVEERNIMIDKQSGKDFDRIGYISLKQNMLRWRHPCNNRVGSPRSQ